ncbi:MAG TPA: ATPase, partial [Bacillota bacterium]|nr:ATPase [Bacillota bacterium]
MFQGNERHIFPGGNTSLGFFSYYDNIITQEEANRLFIIKGGPGVGKSTFMKRMGEELQNMGYAAEYLHCSSDNDSLDGVLIPKLKIAFIDGTSPHVVDPKSPGAVDEILNFGEFWDEEGIRAHKDDIIRINKEIKYIFSRAYKYIKAAYTVYEGSASIYSEAVNRGAVNQMAEKLIAGLFDGEAAAAVEGKQRSMFASALTPNGYSNYLGTVLTAEKVYEFKGGLGTGEDGILEKIRAAARERGHFVEAYYCALDPYKLDHLVIPGLNVAFTTNNSYHGSEVKKFAVIDMNQFMNEDILKHYKDDLDENMTEFDHLMTVALRTIASLQVRQVP